MTKFDQSNQENDRIDRELTEKDRGENRETEMTETIWLEVQSGCLGQRKICLTEIDRKWPKMTEIDQNRPK